MHSLALKKLFILFLNLISLYNQIKSFKFYSCKNLKLKITNFVLKTFYKTQI